MELADRVHLFPAGKFNPFSWYVIEDAGKFTVVDGGWPKHYRSLKEGLASLGKSISDIEGILLTHAHPDHTGFLEKLSKDTGLPVHVHVHDFEEARNIVQTPPPGFKKRIYWPFVARFVLHAFANGAYPFGGVPNLTNLKEIEDGEEIDVPGRPTAILTPGHTPGETCFDMPDRGVLMSGDTLVTLDLYRGRTVEPYVPHEELSHDYVAAVNALASIENLGEREMLSGHGPMWSGDMCAAVAGARRIAADALGARRALIRPTAAAS